MIPEIYHLELHLSQVVHELGAINYKVANGLFNNNRIKEYIQSLNQIADGIKASGFSKLSDIDKILRKNMLIFLSQCIQYIKSATINDLRPAIYICLRTALEDWVSDAGQYVITSYKADVYSHHYSPSTINDQVVKSIKDVLSIDIPYKLISIGYPTHLEKDFLSNVSLYHELGHFVDLKIFDISNRITSHIVYHANLPSATTYFPNIDLTKLCGSPRSFQNPEISKLYNYVSEYFADIFAVQYIGRHKIHLSHYLAGDNKFGYSHPSTDARTKAINNFLEPESKHDDFIKLMKSITLQETKRELKIRNASLELDPLLTNAPYSNLKRDQLHTIFHNGWEIWESNLSNFKNYPEYIAEYERLNSLLEQSVLNYEATRKATST